MYSYTTYKAFVAKAAASLMQKMVGKAIERNSIDMNGSCDDNGKMMEHIALLSVHGAELLAQELKNWWRVRGDKSTVMFDPQDTLMSGVENVLNDVHTALEGIDEKINVVVNQIEDETL